jgi:hypothetical protein
MVGMGEIEVLHRHGFTMRTIQLVMIAFFGGKYFFIDRIQ